jgi:hypothetical protein
MEFVQPFFKNRTQGMQSRRIEKFAEFERD